MVHYLFCNLKLHSIITYDLLLGDIVPEHAQLIRKQSDAKSEVLNALPYLNWSSLKSRWSLSVFASLILSPLMHTTRIASQASVADSFRASPAYISSGTMRSKEASMLLSSW
jgi:hypothetical protein